MILLLSATAVDAFSCEWSILCRRLSLCFFHHVGGRPFGGRECVFWRLVGSCRTHSTFYGRAYVTSNEDPRCTQNPIYAPIFIHNNRSWLLGTPVDSVPGATMYGLTGLRSFDPPRPFFFRVPGYTISSVPWRLSFRQGGQECRQPTSVTWRLASFCFCFGGRGLEFGTRDDFYCEVYNNDSHKSPPILLRYLRPRAVAFTAPMKHLG